MKERIKSAALIPCSTLSRVWWRFLFILLIDYRDSFSFDVALLLLLLPFFELSKHVLDPRLILSELTG